MIPDVFPLSHVRHKLDSAQPSSWAKDAEKIVPFGSQLVSFYQRKGVEALTIAEGDTDAVTLWLRGISAIAIPGATQHGLLTLAHVDAFPEVRLALDSDTAGEDAVKQTARHLRTIGFKGRIRRLSTAPYKDVNAMHLALNGTFDAEWEQRATDAPDVSVPVESRDIPGGLIFTSVGDLMNEPEEQTAFLVDGLLPTAGTSLLVAKPKVGKSTTARTLALCVARGADFLGRRCVQGAVAWLALEEKRGELRGQFRAMGATPDDPIAFFCGRAPADIVDQLREYAKRNPAALIVIDPLIRLTKSRDLNDYAQVAGELEPITILARESGAHLILLHHSPKSGDDVLGSTALFANVDTLLVIKKSPEGQRTITSTQRYGVDLEEAVIERDPETGLVQATGTRKDADDHDARRLIVAFLGTCVEPVDESMIRENVEARRSVLVAALRGLVKDRGVSRAGDGKRGSPYTYALPENVSGSGDSDKPWEPENQKAKSTEKPRQTEVYSSSRDYSSNVISGNDRPGHEIRCAFHVGSPGEPCRRCDMPWPAHVE